MFWGDGEFVAHFRFCFLLVLDFIVFLSILCITFSSAYPIYELFSSIKINL